MKIAVFYNLDFGGAKRAVFEHTNRLREKGNIIDVYTTDSNKDIFNLDTVASNFYKYEFTFSSGSVPVLSRIVKDFNTFYSLNKLHKRIASDIDKKKYDIVLVHPDKITQAPFILRHLKTKSVYYCQEPLRMVYEYSLRIDKSVGLFKYLYEEITRGIRKRIDIQNVRSASFTLASCYHVRERMIEAYNVYPKVSYLGIEENKFKPLGLRKNNQVLFLGRKDVWNDGYDLVEKAMNLVPKNKRPKVVIVPWRKENGLRLSDTELVKQYNESLVTLNLSRFETFGLTPLESMSSGTPVIATKVSGHRETVVDGEGGYLVDFDPYEIRNAFEEILKDKEIAERGRRYVLSNWTWKKRFSEFESLLNKMISNEIK